MRRFIEPPPVHIPRKSASCDGRRLRMQNKPRINVLLVNDHLGWQGSVMHGVGRLFLNWIPKFNKDRYNVVPCILRKEDRLSQYFHNRGIKVRFLGKRKFDPLTLISFLRIIRQEKIDVMHVQGFGATTFGRLARIFTGVPILVHFHDTSTYYPLVQRISDRMLARFTDAALAVSESVRKFWIENGRVPGLDADKIVVMHNCVPISECKIPSPREIATAKQHLGIDADTKIIGALTRLYESKGNRYLLEAAVEILSAFPRTMFLIVGDGPLRKELEELSARLGISDHVLFTGFVENGTEFLGLFDVKVFPSYEGEGTPLAVLEAMAMGKPIVTTNIVEIIEDGVTGLVVPIRNSKAIAQTVISLLMDEDIRCKLGSNARQESRKYDVPAYMRKLERIYDDLVYR